MNPFKLIREGTDKAVAQACGACGRVYALDDERGGAVECCDREAQQTRRKREDEARNAEWEVRRATQKAHALATAKRVPESEYAGPLYIEEDDRYFRDADELREHYEDDGEPIPEVAEACFVKRFALPAASELIANEAQNGDYHDDCEPDDDDADLQAAVDAYNAKQTDETWSPNGILVVLAKEVPHA